MKATYLSVTFRKGRLLAAYLYLPRRTRDKSASVRRVGRGLLVDVTSDGRAIGVEILHPRVALTALNRILREFGVEPVTRQDIAPLRAA
jgi:hypothetical protein